MKKNSFLAFLFSLVLVIGICFINNNTIYAADDFEVGVNNLNGTSENSAKVGDVLTHPEQGWKRYDDKYTTGIKYDNSFGDSVISSLYEGSEKVSNKKGAEIKFYARCSEIRILASKCNNRLNNNHMEIFIDGVSSGKINMYASKLIPQTLLFEKKFDQSDVHYVVIKNISSDGRYSLLDAVDINNDGEILPWVNESLTLNKNSISFNKYGSFNLNAKLMSYLYTAKDVVWSSSDESVAIVNQNGDVTGVGTGKAIIQAKIAGTNLLDECIINVTSGTILDIEPEKEKINLNQEVTANVTIDNITEIAAEDMLIKYDSEKLKFLGAEQVDGIKVVKDEETEGQLRVILASQGKDNIVNAKKVLLKLNFQGIAVGDALVDITKGKISDGIEMERDLLDDECGQATITIEDFKEPNKDGEFTLLDLAIDGRYYGLNPSDYPQYKTDVVENCAIDDDDLLQIGQYMMENPDYLFN